MALGVIVLVINAGLGYVYANDFKVKNGYGDAMGLGLKRRRCLSRYSISGESAFVPQNGGPLVCACCLRRATSVTKLNNQRTFCCKVDILWSGRRVGS